MGGGSNKVDDATNSVGGGALHCKNSGFSWLLCVKQSVIDYCATGRPSKGH